MRSRYERRSTNCSISIGRERQRQTDGLELIAQELRERDADSVLDTEFFREKAAISVTAGSIRETLEWLVSPDRASFIKYSA